MDDVVTLFRPTGPRELVLVAASGYLASDHGSMGAPAGPRLVLRRLVLLAVLSLVHCAMPTEPSTCPANAVEDEASGECVPEACGIGPWGLIGRGVGTIHVASWGDDGGDGSETSPYRTIQKGADEAGGAGGGLVAVGGGTYVENLVLDHDHDGVVIAGRCREWVTIDGSGEDGSGVHVFGGAIGLQDLTVTAGNIGIWVEAIDTQGGSADVHLVRLSLDHDRLVGLVVEGAGATVQAEDVTVTETELTPEGAYGRGVEVQDGAALTATDLHLDGNHDIGLFVSDGGTTAVLQTARILDTRPQADGTRGRGISVHASAALSATDLHLEGNHQAGMFVSGPGTTVVVQTATIQDTRPLPDGTLGRGVNLQDGATLFATDLLLERNHDIGLFESDSGTTAVLETTRIVDTQPGSDGTFGRGVSIQGGATLSATDLLVEGNLDVGMLVAEPGTVVTLDGARIGGTQPMPDGTGGRGLSVQLGAELSATDLLLEGNHELGLYVASQGTTVVLHAAQVLDTQPSPAGKFGQGVGVRDGAALSATDLLVEGNHEAGLYASGPGTTVVLQGARILGTHPLPGGSGGRGLSVEDGAALSAMDLVIEGNQDIGLLASNPGTAIDLVGARIAGTRPSPHQESGIGLAVQEGAAVTVSGIEIEGNGGPGVYVVGGTALLSEFDLLGNAFAGAVLFDGSLTLDGGSISGSVPGPGEGGGVGVFAWNTFGPPDLRVEGVTFAALPGSAFYLRGPGRYVLTDCDVSGTGTWPSMPGGALAVDGVGAWTGDEGLLLQGNTFSSLAADAILLDGSSATLAPQPDTGDPNQFADLEGEPLFFQRCGDAAVPEVLDGGAADSSCRAGARALGPFLEYWVQVGESELAE